MGEIEAWVETKRHNGRRSLRSADSGEYAENTMIVHAQMMKPRIEWEHAVQVSAFNPILVFAGKIAGIFAGLVHGNDDDFDGNRRSRSRVDCARTKTEEQAQQTTAHLHEVSLSVGWLYVSRVTPCIGERPQKASQLSTQIAG